MTLQIAADKRRQWVVDTLNAALESADGLADVAVVEVYPDGSVGVRGSNIAKHTLTGILADAQLSVLLADEAAEESGGAG